MEYPKQKLTILLFLFCLFSYGQESKDYLRMSKQRAESILSETLNEQSSHNVIDGNPILLNEEKAIEFAELVLFDKYEKKYILRQKPYAVFLINDYWVISGTLPKAMRGGTFIIIIDSRNYEILRLTHEK